MRRPLIAGNWKMYKTSGGAREYLGRFKSLSLKEGVEVVILAPYTALPVFQAAGMQDVLQYGAQNVFWVEEGAFTGEISAAMLLDWGCKYVLIGHSERRQVLRESNRMINLKMASALRNGLKPILCVGETLEERRQGQAEKVVARQLRLNLKGLKIDADTVIAYEPVWAIGTGVNATARDAQDMCWFIRDRLASMYDAATADGVRILYGGSVKPDNISELMHEPDIDGALVGGASLEPDSFAAIINY